jgi:hypothetical protein
LRAAGDELDIFTVVVGVLSIILGVAAIGIAWKLYRMSEDGADKMRLSESKIAEHVRELDRIYGLLYSDTWALVRDTYTTMHDKMWRSVSETRGQTAEVRPFSIDSRSTSSKTPPVSTAHDAGRTEGDVRGADELDDFLVQSYHRLSEHGGRVRAQELISVAERLGYPFDDALHALHNVVFLEKRLYLASKRFSPNALVAASAEEAHRLQEELADETMDELTRDPQQQDSASPGNARGDT